MRTLNRLTASLMCIALAALLIVPAAAHGCHGGRAHRSQAQATVAVCPYEDCTLTGRHVHDGVTYCGYAHSTGVCDGACRALCPYEDCALTGRHVHDGVTYCGFCHDAGYCDGSCISTTPCGHGHGHGHCR